MAFLQLGGELLAMTTYFGKLYLPSISSLPSALKTLLVTAMAALAGCASQPAKISMDTATSEHPATQRFIAFSDAAKTAESFEALWPEFYTSATAEKVSGLLGWRRFVYSAPYTVLSKGDCEQIELKRSGSRVQLDCIGTATISSMILGDQLHRMHLRAFMTQQNGQWFMDQAGYVTTQAGVYNAGFTRAGLKFESELEKQYAR